MLKVKNKVHSSQHSFTLCKVFCVLAIILCFSSFNKYKHPFYIGVVEIKFAPKTEQLNVSVKLFTNDLENELKKLHAKSFDFSNAKNKDELNSHLKTYLNTHLSMDLNSKPTPLSYLGFELEGDVIWIYLESQKVSSPKSLVVQTKLLYDFLPQQTNIIHTEINGVSKSKRVTNPESLVDFSF